MQAIPLIIEVNAPIQESRLYLDEYLHLPMIPRLLESWKLRRAEVVTTVSTALKEQLIQDYGLEDRRVWVIPNGADVNAFNPQVEPDASVSDRLSSRAVVGFVGSFKKWHGIELLARAVLRIGAMRPEVGFLFVGVGPEIDRIRALRASLGDRLAITGAVPHDRVPFLVAAIDVGIVAEAAYYQCPLKVLELMAAGKATVAPDQSPLRELIEPDTHGLLFDSGSEAAMVNAVLRLVDSPKLRRDLGHRAANRIRAGFTWNHNAAKVIKACRYAQSLHASRSLGSRVSD